MLFRIKYLRSRTRRDGTTRYWWEHPRFGSKVLPQEPEAAAREAQRLTALAAAGKFLERDVEKAPGTVAWCLAKYRSSERYRGLAASSRHQYERWLVKFRDLWSGLPAGAVTRKVVRKLAASLAERPGERLTALSVLSGVLEVARDEDLIAENPCHRLRLKQGPRRARCPSRSEIARIIRQLRKAPHGRAAAVWLRLLYYTGQRPMDVVRLSWANWDGAIMRLRQQKTDKLVWVPGHRSLRVMLGQLKRKTELGRIVPAAGPDKRVYARLHAAFTAAWRASGIEPVQVRDFRRAAVVALGEAGAEPQQVGAITGHSLNETLRILETYMPRTRKMAADAMAAWERAGNKVGRISDAHELTP